LTEEKLTPKRWAAASLLGPLHSIAATIFSWRSLK
jgi:hypothetical protein